MERLLQMLFKLNDIDFIKRRLASSEVSFSDESQILILLRLKRKTVNSFEQNLQKLEQLTSDIKRSDISLEDALKDFEEGIKLASGMEKQLDEIEGKIQILMNEPNPMTKDNPPQMDLFSDDGEVNGTRK